MPCAAFDGFAQVSEHLNEKIHKAPRIPDIWKNLVPRTKYGKEKGREKTSFTMGQSHPASVVQPWQDVGTISPDNPQGACKKDYTDITFGYDKRTYGPEKCAVRGPILCEHQFAYDWKPRQFVNSYVQQLGIISDETIGNRLQEHYISLSNKAVCVATPTVVSGVALGPTAGSATLPTTVATSPLTQDFLDQIAMELNLRGGFHNNPDAGGFISLGDQGPIYTILIGQEISDQLRIQLGTDDKLYQAILTANTGKGSASELMKGIGAVRVIRNFRHKVTLLPPRYNFTDGAYVRVEPYTQRAGTGKGTVDILNPDYLTAGFEGAIVLHPAVMTEEVVEPENAGLNFDPISYYGNWKWITGAYRICPDGGYDPEDELGRHFANFEHAIEPVHPEFGYTLIFKRCEKTLGLDCGTPA
jgi:hypothetical protein